MLEIQEIVRNIYNTLKKEDLKVNFKKQAKELIMHSLIIGVCFERSLGKTEKEFQEILNIISSLKLLIEAETYDKQGLITTYNRVAIKNDDVNENLNQIKELYESVQFQQELKQETKEFYACRSKQQKQQSRTQIKQNKQEVQKEQQVQCSICLESSSKNQMKILKCQNIFHSQCLNQFFLAQMKSKEWPFLCPVCKKEIHESDIQEVIGHQKMLEVSELSFQKYVQQHSDEVSCCPTPDCVYVFIPNRQSFFGCQVCKKQYCLNCKVEYHHKLTCQQFKESQTAKKDKELDDQFLNFVKGAKFKQCPKCKFWVEKTQGCPHMTCRCKFEFCYTCGGVYKKCKCIK